jgi:gluconolactonase
MYTAAIEILDPRFKSLVHGNVHLEKLYTGCRWAEGPAYFPAGRYLVWSDIPNDRMLRYDECDGAVSVFRQPANNTNGHTVDREGRLVSCEHRGRCVSRTEHDGKRTVLADQWQGKKLNSPNDVVVKSDGSIWFTDPTYGIDSHYEGDRLIPRSAPAMCSASTGRAARSRLWRPISSSPTGSPSRAMRVCSMWPIPA